MSEISELRNLTSEDLEAVATLADISSMLNASYEVEDVLQKVMQVVVDLLSAERGFVMIDRGGDALEVAASAGVPLEDIVDGRFSYSTTIVDRVLREGKPVLSHDALEDDRFSASRSLKSLHTRSIMCVPMKTRNQTLGLIYLDNQTIANLFVPTDRDLLMIVADMAASAIERARYFGGMVARERQAMLGTVVAGILHELNNPLTGIVGFAELALQHLDNRDILLEYLGEISNEGGRCQRLARELLSLARTNKRVRTTVDLSALVDRVGRLVRGDFDRDRVRLLVETPAELPGVSADPDQIIQILLNLVTNARLCLKGRGDGEVLVRVSMHDDALARRHGLESARIRIQVADNGPGIPPENMRRIFEPFFSTRPQGEGTGLGLSIVQRLVLEHRGAITVHNAPHGGAVFTIDLPPARVETENAELASAV